MKNKEKVKQGKKNKASGGRFELKVRKDLEKQGWIVTKWSNNIEFYNEDIHDLPFIRGKLIPAKRKYNPFNRALTIGTGFPDFICFRIIDFKSFGIQMQVYKIIGVEVKSNGYLKPEEKEKCQWLLKNRIFSEILIASKSNKRGKINYIEYA